MKKLFNKLFNRKSEVEIPQEHKIDSISKSRSRHHGRRNEEIQVVHINSIDELDEHLHKVTMQKMEYEKWSKTQQLQSNYLTSYPKPIKLRLSEELSLIPEDTLHEMLMMKSMERAMNIAKNNSEKENSRNRIIERNIKSLFRGENETCH